MESRISSKLWIRVRKVERGSQNKIWLMTLSLPGKKHTLCCLTRMLVIPENKTGFDLSHDLVALYIALCLSHVQNQTRVLNWGGKNQPHQKMPETKAGSKKAQFRGWSEFKRLSGQIFIPIKSPSMFCSTVALRKISLNIYKAQVLKHVWM